MKIRDAYGSIIRTARMEQGKTLKQVADVAFMSRGYLYEIEQGIKEPSSEYLRSILDSLEITPPDFFEEVAQYLREQAA